MTQCYLDLHQSTCASDHLKLNQYSTIPRKEDNVNFRRLEKIQFEWHNDGFYTGCIKRIILFILSRNVCYEISAMRERGCPRGVMVKALDCGIVVRYCVHFRANTLGKGMNPLILPAMG